MLSSLPGIETQYPGFAALSLVPIQRVYFDGIYVLQSRDQWQALMTMTMIGQAH
jgi:hypothetical protein